MSLDFLTPAPGVPAQSPMERLARAAGARLEVRDGWNVAVDYASPPPADVGWADLSHLAKLELHGEHGARPGTAERHGEAWLCPLTPRRALAVGEREAARALSERDGIGSVVDVTCAYAALGIVGPAAREVIARLSALDLRPQVAPVAAFRPGSVARTPAMVLREAEERYLVLFGAALGEYVWTVVADAAQPDGGGPVGLAALAPVAEPQETGRA